MKRLVGALSRRTKQGHVALRAAPSTNGVEGFLRRVDLGLTLDPPPQMRRSARLPRTLVYSEPRRIAYGTLAHPL